MSVRKSMRTLAARPTDRRDKHRGSSSARRPRCRPAVESLEHRDCPSGLAFSTYLGGSANDGGDAIAVDAAGNVYVAGHTASANFPVTPGAYSTTFNGSGDEVFVAKFNPSGSL